MTLRQILQTVLAACALSGSAWAQQAGWQELPNTPLKNVCPPDNFGSDNYAFSAFARGVISAWGGGIADTKRNRLILWGGGHADYSGNELYALNLNANPITFTRLT